MKKIKIGFYIFLIIVVLVGIFGGWTLMRAYAGSVDIEDPKILLSIEKGIVYHQAGQGFVQITEEVEIDKGDSVRTTTGAVAKIVFFDTQEVFLDEDSEIYISEAYIDQNTPFLTKVDIQLLKGQVWSRLLELLHPESSFEVQSDSVVATVRGTSFNFAKQGGKINIAVFENSVGVYDKNDLTDSAVVNADDILTYSKNGAVELDSQQEAEQIDSEDIVAEIVPKQKKSRFLVRKLEAEEKKIDWIKNNVERDTEFKELIRKRRQNIFNQIGPLPGSTMYHLKRVGERLALAFAQGDAEKEKIENSLELRRLLEVEALIEKGQVERAMLFSRRLSPDQSLLLKIKRLRALDPDFSEKLKSDEQIKSYFFNVLDSYERGYLINKITPVESMLNKIQENAESNELAKQIQSAQTELTNIRGLIEELQNQRKILLTDLENLEQNINFTSDTEAAEFKEKAENIRKRLFDIENQLNQIQQGHKEVQALATNYESETDVNISEISQAIARLNDKITGIEKLLENIETEIIDLAENYGTAPATSDSELKLLNQSPDL